MPPAPDDAEVARAIEAWMQGAHDRPLHLAWWMMPPPDAFAFASVPVIVALALALGARARVRARCDGVLLHIESRRVFGARSSAFVRSEVRAVSVESRTFGPLSFARPLIVTKQGRKVPVGPFTLSDVAAADFATRIRALVAEARVG